MNILQIKSQKYIQEKQNLLKFCINFQPSRGGLREAGYYIPLTGSCHYLSDNGLQILQDINDTIHQNMNLKNYIRQTISSIPTGTTE